MTKSKYGRTGLKQAVTGQLWQVWQEVKTITLLTCGGVYMAHLLSDSNQGLKFLHPEQIPWVMTSSPFSPTPSSLSLLLLLFLNHILGKLQCELNTQKYAQSQTNYCRNRNSVTLWSAVFFLQALTRRYQYPFPFVSSRMSNFKFIQLLHC